LFGEALTEAWIQRPHNVVIRTGGFFHENIQMDEEKFEKLPSA
jgi:hypothetical protein